MDIGGSDTLGSMFLVVPTAFGRDLEDLVVQSRGGEEWLQSGGTVFRPQATVPRSGAADPAGGHLVLFGDPGDAIAVAVR